MEPGSTSPHSGTSTAYQGKTEVMSFHNICYSIEKQKSCSGVCRGIEKKKILDNVSGILKPGLNAILGPSGSGKTSLLDVLVGRKNPERVSGTVLMNGDPLTQNIRHQIGYVVQSDLHISTVTVREALWFCANLRLPTSISTDEKAKRVERILEELSLTSCSDTKIGNEEIRGLSGGEKKRTSIALELILEPKILFLDEPTTGLDAATAWSVVFLLKRLCDKGHTIVFSIHQPRYSIYKFFDRLTLLENGGVVYHGPRREAISYFEEMGYELDANENPANFLLDVLQGVLVVKDQCQENDTEIRRTAEDTDKLKMRYLGSEYYTLLEKEIALLQERAQEPKNRGIEQPNLHQTTRLHQFKFLAQRTGKDFIRNPAAVVPTFFLHTVVALILGLWFFQLNDTSEKGIQNRLGLFFLFVIKFTLSSLTAVSVFHKERAIFIHERASGYYDLAPYYFSKIFADLIPKRTVGQLTICCITYWMAGLTPDVGTFFIFVLTSFLLSHATTAIAYFMAATFDYEFGQIMTHLVFVTSLIFSGALVNISSVVPWLAWLQYLSTSRYGLSAFCINEMSGRYFSSCSNATRSLQSLNDLHNDSLIPRNYNLTPRSDGSFQSIDHQNATTCDLDSGDDFLRSSMSIADDSDVIADWLLWQNHLALACICVGCHILAFFQLSRVKLYS